MENTSSHDHSENARHLTDSSVREAEEQVNFISDRRRKCAHCGNVADHKPKTAKCPAFHKTCSQCGIQHHFGRVFMKRTPTSGRPQEQKTEHPKVLRCFQKQGAEGALLRLPCRIYSSFVFCFVYCVSFVSNLFNFLFLFFSLFCYLVKLIK